MKTSEQKYNYLRVENWRERKLPNVLYDVGILADGSLYNPRGYPEDLVRAEVLAANERQAQYRSQAAKRAAATRAERRKRKVYQVVQNLRLGHKYGPAMECIVCGKGLSDPPSIERGIGSDCWQEILKILQHEQQS